MGGAITSAFFKEKEIKALKNLYLAQPTPQFIYQAVLKALPKTTGDNYVDFSHTYTKKSTTTFRNGHHILTHLKALLPTAAVGLNICNTYYVSNAAELILANLKTINVLIKLSTLHFTNPNAPDKHITFMSNYIDAICQGQDPIKCIDPIHVLASSQPQKIVSPIYLEEQKNKNKTKNNRKNNKNNYYSNKNNNNYGNKTNNGSQQSNKSTEPPTQHLDKNLTNKKAKKSLPVPQTHMCWPSSCKVQGCRNNPNN